MTTLIIIGIIIGALVLHFTIGNIAALKLAPKIAELSNRVEVEGQENVHNPTRFEYEWENNRERSDKQYRTRWLTNSWQPVNDKYETWHRTGSYRKADVDPSSKEEVVVKFDQSFFTFNMGLVRWFWFIGVPLVLNASVDKKMIEKYDPKVSEAKQKALESKIISLEKELEIS